VSACVCVRESSRVRDWKCGYQRSVVGSVSVVIIVQGIAKVDGLYRCGSPLPFLLDFATAGRER